MLTRDQILKAKDRKTETVDVPEWGGSVRVRVMTGAEKDAWEQAIYKVKGEGIEVNAENFRAMLVARTLSDENGPMYFSDDDIRALGRKSSVALDRLYVVARRLNRITPEDREELSKNSDPGLDDISTSSLPGSSG